MSGYKVKRKAELGYSRVAGRNWNEKKLGLHNKQDMKNMVLHSLTKCANESVWEYESEWRKIDWRMAYLIDLDDPYVTLDNNFIESVWSIL